jgi:glycosyltransferase involved in cell wall biosynthesis
MRILVVSLEAPLPPTNGLRLQVTALWHELRKRHDVRVLAYLADDQAGSDQDANLRLVPAAGDRLGRTRLLTNAVLRRRPLRADHLARRLLPALQEELESFTPDVVHVTTGRLAALGNSLRERPAVLAALDAWHLNVEAAALGATKPKRWVLQREARRVRSFERDQYGKFSRVVVVSDEDRAALAALDQGLRITVIPNGVDLARYSPSDGAERDSSSVVFSGVMSYPPNVAAARYLATEVMPLVKEKRPDACLTIVGRAPAPEVTALAEPGAVTVTGEVQDMRAWLSRARVYACPMVSGTGIKNKLLEALSTGLPCVVTPLALQGLKPDVLDHMIVGTTAGELADGLIEVLDDDALAARLGQGGRRYVEQNHDWSSVARAYERLYLEVIGDRRP